jgi:hypothetical protein
MSLRPVAHSPRLPHTLANAVAPSTRSRSQCTGKRLVYKGVRRSVNSKSRLHTIILQSRTEPLEIKVRCEKTKNLTDSILSTLCL